MFRDNPPVHPPCMPLYPASQWGTPAFLDLSSWGACQQGDTLWAGRSARLWGFYKLVGVAGLSQDQGHTGACNHPWV